MSAALNTKTAKVLAITCMCLGLVTACQTTQQDFTTEREVEPSETRIVMPQKLANLNGFKIKKAEIREAASYRSEKTTFTGGLITYGRYFRGEFLGTLKSKFKKKLTTEVADISNL